MDAARRNPANWISTSDVTTAVRGMKAHHVLVVADSCYSGTLTRSSGTAQMRSGGQDEWLRRMHRNRSRTVLTSGGLEPVADSGGGAHSVFARAFIRALQDNRAAKIDMDSLYERIRRWVVLAANQTPVYADIREAGHDDGDFIFWRR